MTSEKHRIFTAAGAVAVACVIVCGAGLLSACKGGKRDEDDTVKITTVAANNFDFFYTPEDVIDFSDFTLTVTYSDRTTKELTSMDPDGHGTADGSNADFVLHTDGLYETAQMHGTAELGRYSLSCTLAEDGEDYDLGDVLVVQDIGSLSLVLFGDPDFVAEYNFNLERCGTRDEDEDNDFAGEAPEDYLVGDDNGFVFRPELTLADPDNIRNQHVQSNYSADVTVTKEGDTEPLKLDDNLYVSYSDFTFQFTEMAVGSRFTVEMTPSDFERNFVNETVGSVGMTVLVCDGYNAYDAADLGHMALVDEGEDLSDFDMSESKRVFWKSTNTFESVRTYELWKEFFREKGEPEDSLVSCNGIFLHRDISVTEADMPERFFVSEREARAQGVNYADMVGSIRDNILPYSHYMTDDFTFCGNLFRIDCSEMKYCLTHSSSSAGTDDEGNAAYGLKYDAENALSTNTSNVRLFAFLGLADDKPEGEGVSAGERHTAVFRDVDISGNMSNDDYEVSGKESGRAAGSMQMMLSNSSRLEMKNCLVKDFVIAVNCENSKSDYTCLDMEDTKIFDCYNCGVYLSNSAKNTVKGSVFKRIGGPAVMARCRTTAALGEDDNYCIASGIDMDEDTVIENYLAGDEAWFTSMGVTFIPNILVWVDELFNSVGKTIYTGESVTKDGGEGTSSPALNLHYMGLASTSSSSVSNRLNIELTMGGYTFLLNEEGFAKDENGKDVTRYDGAYYAKEADFVSAMLNWSMDHSNLGLSFVTNSGEMFTGTVTSILGGTDEPFYTLESFYAGSLVPQVLGPEDTEVFIYSWIGGYGAVLALSLADLEEDAD
ncbi:MAG: right-handed parallel beta-helix repeat-containing protein [Clostridia bacterium]|nr:right-handed parallel beta-helix repeat-containing protein [Clostridia bacterium]